MKIKPGDIVKNRDGRIGVVLYTDKKNSFDSRYLVLMSGKPVSILSKNLFKVVGG